MEQYNFPRKATSSQMQCEICLSGLSVGLLQALKRNIRLINETWQ